MISITGGTVRNLNGGYAIYNAYSLGGNVGIAATATITGKLYPATNTPTATITTVSKAEITSNSVAFSLTNSPAYFFVQVNHVT